MVRHHAGESGLKIKNSKKPQKRACTRNLADAAQQFAFGGLRTRS